MTPHVHSFSYRPISVHSLAVLTLVLDWLNVFWVLLCDSPANHCGYQDDEYKDGPHTGNGYYQPHCLIRGKVQSWRLGCVCVCVCVWACVYTWGKLMYHIHTSECCVCDMLCKQARVHSHTFIQCKHGYN